MLVPICHQHISVCVYVTVLYVWTTARNRTYPPSGRAGSFSLSLSMARSLSLALFGITRSLSLALSLSLARSLSLSLSLARALFRALSLTACVLPAGPTIPEAFTSFSGTTPKATGTPVLIGHVACGMQYRGTSLIRNRHSVGPYSRTMLRLLWRSWGGGQFLMSEVPLYRVRGYPDIRARDVTTAEFCRVSQATFRQLTLVAFFIVF